MADFGQYVSDLNNLKEVITDFTMQYSDNMDKSERDAIATLQKFIVKENKKIEDIVRSNLRKR